MDAVALASSIITFIDCGVKLCTYASEIRKSSTGLASSTEGIGKCATEVLTAIDLIRISQSLAASRGTAADLTPLLDDCNSVADDIRAFVEKLRMKPG